MTGEGVRARYQGVEIDGDASSSKSGHVVWEERESVDDVEVSPALAEDGASEGDRLPARLPPSKPLPHSLLVS